jgi:hypothetical protein
MRLPTQEQKGISLPVLFSRDRLAVGGLLLATLLYFSPYLFSGKTVVPYDLLLQMPPWHTLATEPPQNWAMADVIRQYVPWRILYRQALLSGEIPFWNPYTFNGMPFLANHQSDVLYPFNLLFLIPSLDTAYILFLMVHVFLAGSGMYCLLRTFTLSVAASLVGAFVWMFSGLFTVWLVWLSIPATLTWFPWLLLAACWLARAGKPWSIAALALVVTLTILGGHPQFAYYSMLTVGTFVLFQASMLPGAWTRRISYLLRFSAGCGLGFALAAAQLVPTLELASHGTRGALPISELMVGAIPWSHAWTLLVPELFGDVNNYGGAGNFVEFTGYVGVVTLLFAMLAFLHPRLPRQAFLLFFVVLAFLALHLAYGGVINRPLSYLPGYTLFRGLQRLYCVWSLAIAVVAAWGVESALLVRGWRRWMAGALALAVAFGALVALAQPEALLDWIEQTAQADLQDGRAEAVMAAARHALWLMAGTGAIVLMLVLRPLTQRRSLLAVASLAPAVIVGIDLIGFARGYLPVVDRALAYPVTPGIEYLQANRADGAIVRFGEGPLATPLPPNSGIVFGLEDTNGYDSFTLDSHNRLAAVVEPGLYGHVGHWHFLSNLQDPEALGSPVLDLMGAAYLLSSRELPPQEIAQGPCDRPAGELLPGREVGQTFVAREDGLQAIDVPVATYARANQGRLRLELRSAPDTSQVLASHEVDVSTLVDNQHLSFLFPPIPDSADRSFYLALEAVGSAPGNAVTVWTSGMDSYHAGSLWEGGEELEGDLCLRLHSRERAQWEHVYSGADMVIYRNRKVLPLAYLVSQIHVVPELEAQVAALAAPAFDPTNSAILDAATSIPISPDATGAARVVQRTLNTLQLDVEVESPSGGAALLVISQNNYPGWTATVDGIDTPILNTNLALQGVVLTSGKHLVVLRYQPGHLPFALGISMLAALTILLTILSPRLARIRQRDLPPSDQ